MVRLLGGVWPLAALRALQRPSVPRAAEAVWLSMVALRPLVAPVWRVGKVLQQVEAVRLAVALRPAVESALRLLAPPSVRVS